ncbi:unnamed protein product [Urochloa humidicola]
MVLDIRAGSPLPQISKSRRRSNSMPLGRSAALPRCSAAPARFSSPAALPAPYLRLHLWPDPCAAVPRATGTAPLLASPADPVAPPGPRPPHPPSCLPDRSSLDTRKLRLSLPSSSAPASSASPVAPPSSTGRRALPQLWPTRPASTPAVHLHAALCHRLQLSPDASAHTPGIMGHFTRFRSHMGKEVMNEAETDGRAHGTGEGDGGGEGANHEGSPSTYLNLQYGGDEEHVGNRSEVMEASVKPKGKRGRSKMPQGRTVILAVDASREPVDPITVQGPYKTAIGNIVRDNVPIKYQCWIGKKDPTWTVPDSVKELCWGKLLERFTFPGEEAMKVAKKKALKTVGESFKQFRCALHKLVKEGTEPDWLVHPSQRPYWPEFVEYKLSEEAKAISEKNSENAQKNPFPHTNGSRGIVRKMPEWDAELDELERNGVERETED